MSREVKNRRFTKKQGWVEVDKYGQIVSGRMGFKVYRFRKDILNKGFSLEEVAKVKIEIKSLT